MKKTYEFKTTARYSKRCDAQAIGETLAKIEKAETTLKTADVLAAAGDPASPLHPCFEWDETKAAHGYRMEQARCVIKSLVVLMPAKSKNDPQVKTVAYIHAPDGAKQGYYSPEVLMGDPAIFARAYDELIRRIGSLQKGLNELDILVTQSDDSDQMSKITVALSAAKALESAINVIRH